jgi:hypothetical protein
MAIRVLLYCLKVWVSALVIGTLLLITMIYVFSQAHPLQSDLRFALLLSLYGLGFSIPSLLLAWLGSFFIIKGPRSGLAKRLWIAGLGAPLTLLPFVIFEGGFLLDWQPTCLIAGLYYLSTVLAIFVFPLPEIPTAHT